MSHGSRFPHGSRGIPGTADQSMVPGSRPYLEGRNRNYGSGACSRGHGRQGTEPPTLHVGPTPRRWLRVQDLTLSLSRRGRLSGSLQDASGASPLPTDPPSTLERLLAPPDAS